MAAPACDAEPVDDPESLGQSLAQPDRLLDLSVAEIDAIADLAIDADAAFAGRVESIAYQMSDPDEQGDQLPFTLVTWRVEDGIKGVVTDTTYTARFLGGPIPDGKILTISEIPRFEVGDRDLLFVRDNGRVGNPLVGGMRGRIRLAGRDAGWSAAIAGTIRDAGLDVGEPAPRLNIDEPFVFSPPRPATRQELEAMAARVVSKPRLAPAKPQTEAERAELAALRASNFNPVLSR